MFVHHRIVSALKRVEFVSDRMLHRVLGGRWCNIIVLVVHAQSEKKSDDSMQFLRGIKACFRSFSEVQHDNYVRGF